MILEIDADKGHLFKSYLTRAGANVIVSKEPEDWKNTVHEKPHSDAGSIDAIIFSKSDKFAHLEEYVSRIYNISSESNVRFFVGIDTLSFGSEIDLDSRFILFDDNPVSPGNFLTIIAGAFSRIEPEWEQEQSEVSSKALQSQSIEEALAADQLILLVEDNLTNRQVISMQLSHLGYAFECAEDGQQALEMWRQKRYRLLLTDCHMPNMDGYELAKIVREESLIRGEDRCPIIAITASVLEEEVKRCLEAGMDDFLGKPVELVSLKEMLKKWMSSRIKLLQDPIESGNVITRNIRNTVNAEPVHNLDASLAVIDESYLIALFGGGVDIIDILKDFISPAKKIVGEIDEAVSEKNAIDLKLHAHKLKSAARSIGANSLANLCYTLESEAEQEDWDHLDSVRLDLNAEYVRVEDYIQSK